MFCVQVAIIENEAYFKDQLEKQLNIWAESNGSYELVIHTFTTGEEFLKESINNYHFIFMDIELDGTLNGIETARISKSRGSRTPLAFLTMHDVYVFDGYDTNAISYLLKPVRYEEVSKCMEKALNRISYAKYIYNSKDTILSIPYQDILYIQSALHYSEMITVSDSISQRISLSKLAEQLPKQFVRCHRTTIVNIIHVKAIKQRELKLTNSVVLTISKPYLEAVQNAYVEWIS